MQHSSKRLFQISLLIVAIMLSGAATVFAGRGYFVIDKSIRPGMLVSLTQNTEVVEASNDKNMSTLLGVIGSSQTDFDVGKDQVSVQTDGVVDSLVSTISGDIKVGDHIGPSSIVGFGAKVGSSGWSVGIAQESLDVSTKGAVKSTVTDSLGVKHDVYVATIPVSVHISYVNAQQQNQSQAVPTRIQKLADSLAGKRASQLAIILGTLLLLAGFVIAGIIVNAAVRNGLQSIARQPLAKQEIIHGMLRSFAVAIGILILATVGTLIIIRVI